MGLFSIGPTTPPPTPTLITDLQITTAESGTAIPLLIGTKIMPGNVVWYGDMSSSPVRATSGK